MIKLVDEKRQNENKTKLYSYQQNLLFFTLAVYIMPYAFKRFDSFGRIPGDGKIIPDQISNLMPPRLVD